MRCENLYNLGADLTNLKWRPPRPGILVEVAEERFCCMYKKYHCIKGFSTSIAFLLNYAQLFYLLVHYISYGSGVQDSQSFGSNNSPLEPHSNCPTVSHTHQP